MPMYQNKSNHGVWFFPISPAGEVIFKLIFALAIYVQLNLIWLYAGIALHQLKLVLKAQRCVTVLMAIAMLAVIVVAMSYHFEIVQ